MFVMIRIFIRTKSTYGVISDWWSGKLLQNVSNFYFPLHFSLVFFRCQAAACLRTVKRVTMERGRPTMTSSSMESIVQSVAKAGVVGTVKVSCCNDAALSWHIIGWIFAFPQVKWKACSIVQYIFYGIFQRCWGYFLFSILNLYFTKTLEQLTEKGDKYKHEKNKYNYSVIVI